MTEAKDFDFTGAIVMEEEDIRTPEEIEDEEKIDVEVAEETRKLKGFPTAEVIAEARALAESPKGLELDKFSAKHGLINVNIEQLLHAPLHEDGPKKGTFK